jgi:flagellar protein FliO/FliZ
VSPSLETPDVQPAAAAVSETAIPFDRFLRPFTTLARTLMAAVQWSLRRAKSQRAAKTLCVSESISLGEKRFVAVVQVDGERFLIGGSSTSVSVLAKLREAQSFARALDECRAGGEPR